MPKYSILLPIHNGKRFISECLSSILSINYTDYELIISDNFSDDGTYEYLIELQKKYSCIKLIRTNHFISQVENWNNVIKEATGEWVYLLGIDDAVTPFFFEIADILTNIADKKQINIIKCNRIYYFWNDLEIREIYNNLHVSFNISNRIEVKSTKKIFYNGLYSDGFYDMPQMYTTAMFRNKMIKNLINNQKDENLIKYESPDAYLGVLACCCEKKMLYSGIPIAWVGSSSSSQGYRDKKKGKSLSQSYYLDFSAKTYETVNSTNLLVAGAYNTINKFNIQIKNKFKINIPKLLFNVIQNNSNKEAINELLNSFGFTCDKLNRKYLIINFISIQIKKIAYNLRQLNIRIENKLYKILQGDVKYKNYSFSIDFTDDNDFSFTEINSKIKNCENIREIINSVK